MLLAISNLSSDRVFKCQPWETRSDAPPETCWYQLDLDHVFFSGFEGAFSPGRIDSKDNPATKIHWIVADYDGSIDRRMRDTVLDRCTAFKPRFICRTASGGARLLWKLAVPLPLHRNDLSAKLMRYI